MGVIMVGENAAAKLIESNRIAARFIADACMSFKKKKAWKAFRKQRLNFTGGSLHSFMKLSFI
jgi:hypothetical protein